MWLKPVFSKVRYHDIKSESGKMQRIWVKSGTQIIDRIWGGLRSHLKGKKQVNSHTLSNKIRSFQWLYWNKGADLRAQTGEMLSSIFHAEHGY